MSNSVYDTVTAAIMSSLAKGTVPWRKPWCAAPLPVNAVSKAPYRGVNFFLLSLSPFHDHRWVTFRQASELGGTVKKGERSTEIVFWKPPETRRTDEEDEHVLRRQVPILKSYRVFNVEQCKDLRLMPLPERELIQPQQRIAEAEDILRSMLDPPRLEERHTPAWYRPADDLIGMPPISDFSSADTYYATRFHELGHATGHEKRLNRPGVTGVIQFGSATYGMEELVAELTSSFCSALCGLDTTLLESSASDIQNWLGALRHDTKMVVVAAARAQKAADYIRGRLD